MVGLGGHHIGRRDEATGVRLVRMAIDNGIDFLDNCWDYNEGRSEEWMGKALRDGYRQRAFLMTKLDGQTAAAARAQLEQSLRRLQTEVIDLVQMHEIIRPDDPERCFAAAGAMEALVKAREEGKLRFIGFTGHKDPRIHLHMLEVAAEHGFTFDAVQMPLNLMDAHFRSFEKLVLPALVRDDIAVLGMKPMGDGLILKSNTVTARECLRYALSLPTSVVITGCESVEILEQALDVARTFVPLAAEERAQLLARTAGADHGKFERFKTTGEFDGTAMNPRWLTGAEV